MNNLRLAHRICNSNKDSHVPYHENVRLQALVEKRRKETFAKAQITVIDKRSSGS